MLQPDLIIERAKHMIRYLSDVLSKLKSISIKEGFKSIEDEVYFFKHIKPQILAKLLYYNKIYIIETVSPSYPDVLLENYYQNKLKELTSEFKIQCKSNRFL